MPVKSDISANRWEHFSHEADVGIRGYGTTLAEAFEQAALALTGIVTDADIDDRASVEVDCEASDVEVLLVEWLNAVIYEMAVRNMIFGAFKVTIDELRLHGTMWGEPVDQTKHLPACEPKGATYTALRVAQESDGTWSAACIIDV
jgi:tRNA nucleotidyltransferase (CCA-adding enzyme)